MVDQDDNYAKAVGAVKQFKNELLKTARVNEIQRNIEQRNVLNDIIERKFKEAHILEEEVLTRDNEHLVLFSVEGRPDIDGLAVPKNDIESGKIPRSAIYLALAEGVET